MSSTVYKYSASRALHSLLDLPPEPILHILEMGHTDNTDNLSQRTKFTILCAAVCQNWRRLCIAVPHLWRTITIDLPRQSGMGEMWHVMQSRSSPYTLDILIQLDWTRGACPTSDAVKFIAENRGCMRRLDVEVRSSSLGPTLEQLLFDDWLSCFSSTSLEVLSIHDSRNPVRYSMSLPRLANLTLTGPVWSNNHIPSFAAHLTTLNLVIKSERLNPFPLIELLSATGALEDLALSFKIILEERYTPCTVQLLNLRRLYLCISDIMSAAGALQVLCNIISPALACPGDWYAPLRELFTREGCSYPNLRSLRAQVAVMSVDQFPPALPGLHRACPRLDELIFPIQLTVTMNRREKADQMLLLNYVQWASYGPWPRRRVLDMSELWEDRAYIMPKITSALDEVRHRGKPKLLLKLGDPRIRDDPEMCAALLEHAILM